jgi:hypothetical protein
MAARTRHALGSEPEGLRPPAARPLDAVLPGRRRGAARRAAEASSGDRRRLQLNLVLKTVEQLALCRAAAEIRGVDLREVLIPALERYVASWPAAERRDVEAAAKRHAAKLQK